MSQLLHDEQIVPRPRRVTELRRRLDLPAAAAAAAGAGAAGAGAPPSAAAAAAAAAEPRVYLASPGTTNLLLATDSPRPVTTTRYCVLTTNSLSGLNYLAIAVLLPPDTALPPGFGRGLGQLAAAAAAPPAAAGAPASAPAGAAAPTAVASVSAVFSGGKYCFDAARP